MNTSGSGLGWRPRIPSRIAGRCAAFLLTPLLVALLLQQLAWVLVVGALRLSLRHGPTPCSRFPEAYPAAARPIPPLGRLFPRACSNPGRAPGAINGHPASHGGENSRR